MGICDCGKPTVWNDMCEYCLDQYEKECEQYRYLEAQTEEVIQRMRKEFVKAYEEKVKVEKKYDVELMYKIWDRVNGDCVVIQSGDDEGLYLIGSQVVTIEQIPGIMEALHLILGTQK